MSTRQESKFALQNPGSCAPAGQSLRVPCVRLPVMAGQACSEIILVVDESGSMSGSCADAVSRMGAAKAAALGFVRTKAKLDPAGRLAMVGFSDTPRVALGLTLAADAKAARTAIDALSEKGGTDIAAALEQAAAMWAHGESNKPKHLVLLTDGEHNGAGDPVAVAENLKAIGVEIYCVGFAADPSEVDARLPLIASPGKYLFCKDIGVLVNQFESISIRTSIRRG